MALPPSPNPAALTRLLDLWKAAKRPVIITGTGAGRTTEGENLLLQLAQTTSTPVFFSGKFATPASIPHGNPLRGGPATKLAFLKPLGQDQPDFVLLLGARTGFMLGGRSGVIVPYPPVCKTAQVDIDGGEIGKSTAIELGIVSDASEFIKAFLQLLKQNPIERPSLDSDPWIQTCSGLKHVIHQLYANDEKANKDDGMLHPYHAINGVYEALAPYHPVIIIDGGEAGVWAMDVWETAQPYAGMNSTGYLGFLGNGYWYALGAALAFPDRLIVSVHGDGSAGFHIAELDTYARHGLKILTVVMNNYKWGMSIAGQDIIYGEDDPARPVSSLSPVCKFETVAEGFGNLGVRIEKPDEIAGKVKELVEAMSSGSSGKTAGLINLLVSTQPVTNATKGMVGKPEKGQGEDVIVVPYYDNVPRAYYKEDLERMGWTKSKNSQTTAVNGSAS
jgi:thiamine pyrophosphate-dependent acetolactate synthase large subunit-like protein